MPFRPYSLTSKKKQGFRQAVAAKRIQRAFRSRRKRFNRKVKTVIVSQEPYKFHIMTTLLPTTDTEGPVAVNTDVTQLLDISNIPFNTQTLPHQRNSTKLMAKNLRLIMTLKANTDAFSRIRLLLIRSKRTNNDTGTTGYINCPDTPNLFRFAPPLSGAGQIPALAINAFPNSKFADVVWDKTFTLGTYGAKASTTNTAQPVNYNISGNVPHYSSLHVEKFIKLNKLFKYNPVEDPTSGTEYRYAPYNNMSYYLVAVSNSSSTPNPLVYASASLSFKDLD